MNYDMYQINLNCDYKGGKKIFTDIMPKISDNEDYFNQYFKIWQVLQEAVKASKAKKVLEFGTRDGYSARLFSQALEETGGTLYTVDKDIPKDDFKGLNNIVFIQSLVEDLTWDIPVDILYIDDWHDQLHLYYELNRFAHLARYVLIHDIALNMNMPDDLCDVVSRWAKQNYMRVTYDFRNVCGLAIIETEDK